MKTKQCATREVRTFTAASPLTVRTAPDGSKQIQGTAIVYNSKSMDLGGFTEIVSPDALSRTLRENDDILAMRDHTQTMLLGRTTAGTLQLNNTTTGLDFTISLPKTATGDDTAENVRLGNLTGCSFGFTTVNDSWLQTEDGTLLRTLLDIDLYEISVTSFPAYQSTSVSTRSCPPGLRSKLEQRTGKTKSVDGVSLPPSSFAYVGHPEKTDTWKLPIDFPGDEEKTVSHIKDALARFDQTEGIPESEKDATHAKIVKAAKAHGIHVSKETFGDRSIKRDIGDGIYDDSSDDDSDETEDEDMDDMDMDDEDYRCSCRCERCKMSDCANCYDISCMSERCEGCPSPSRDEMRSDSVRVRKLFHEKSHNNDRMMTNL